jgi:hypothetical protein
VDTATLKAIKGGIARLFGRKRRGQIVEAGEALDQCELDGLVIAGRAGGDRTAERPAGRRQVTGGDSSGA